MQDTHEFRRPSQDSHHENYLIAVHEAGHVVMSFQVELGVTEVSIVPVGDCLGICRNDGSLELRESLDQVWNSDWEQERRGRQLLLKHLQVSLAGPEAERLARGEYNPEGAAGDAETVQMLLGLLGRGKDKAFLDRLRSQIARYLARPGVWSAVEAVALGLLQRGRMTGQEARVLYTRAAAQVDRLDRMDWKPQSISSWIPTSRSYWRAEE
jgi:hypothetical protein